MADIRHSIQSAATPEQVYQLVATASGLGEWWATDIEQPGETVNLGFFNRATVYKLRMSSEARPGHVDWTCESGDEWRGTHIVFDLEANKNGTLIRFAHAGWRAETPYFVSCNTTWGGLMFRLKEAAEGRKPGPLFTRDGLRY
ncbi:MAG TPA: SRPBCC domain-containing protein [Bryobacteraceae bacterium]|nr:SRPBCC domain-containing protein [Bryobacteraceae bacterium]